MKKAEIEVGWATKRIQQQFCYYYLTDKCSRAQRILYLKRTRTLKAHPTGMLFIVLCWDSPTQIRDLFPHKALFLESEVTAAAQLQSVMESCFFLCHSTCVGFRIIKEWAGGVPLTVLSLFHGFTHLCLAHQVYFWFLSLLSTLSAFFKSHILENPLIAASPPWTF